MRVSICSFICILECRVDMVNSKTSAHSWNCIDRLFASNSIAFLSPYVSVLQVNLVFCFGSLSSKILVSIDFFMPTICKANMSHKRLQKTASSDTCISRTRLRGIFPSHMRLYHVIGTRKFYESQ